MFKYVTMQRKMLCVFFFCWISAVFKGLLSEWENSVCACMRWCICMCLYELASVLYLIFFSSVGLAIVFHKRFYLIFPFVETWNCIQICGNSVARYLSTLQLKKNCIKSRAQTISVRRNSPIRVRNCIVVVVVELFWRCMKMTNKNFICI